MTYRLHWGSDRADGAGGLHGHDRSHRSHWGSDRPDGAHWPHRGNMYNGADGSYRPHWAYGRRGALKSDGRLQHVSPNWRYHPGHHPAMNVYSDVLRVDVVVLADDQVWTTPTFLGSWSNWSGSTSPVAHCQSAQRITYLRGCIKCTNTIGISNPIFTLNPAIPGSPNGHEPVCPHLRR